MKINKSNKKIINNLILGSFLFGASVSIITQVQATQRSQYSPKKKEYSSVAISNLKSGLNCRNLSMEVCIRLVRDRDADPNIQVIFSLLPFKGEQCRSLALLEEAILSRYPEAIEIFIANGADTCKVSESITRKFGTEVTLLHLALLTPDEIKALEAIRCVDRADRQKRPNPAMEAMYRAQIEKKRYHLQGHMSLEKLWSYCGKMAWNQN